MTRNIRDNHFSIEAEIDGKTMTYEANQGHTYDKIIRDARTQNIDEAQALPKMRRPVWYDGIAGDLLENNGVMTATRLHSNYSRLLALSW